MTKERMRRHSAPLASRLGANCQAAGTAAR